MSMQSEKMNALQRWEAGTQQSPGTHLLSAADSSKTQLSSAMTLGTEGSGFTSALFITPPKLSDDENALLNSPGVTV